MTRLSVLPPALQGVQLWEDLDKAVQELDNELVRKFIRELKDYRNVDREGISREDLVKMATFLGWSFLDTQPFSNKSIQLFCQSVGMFNTEKATPSFEQYMSFVLDTYLKIHPLYTDRGTTLGTAPGPNDYKVFFREGDPAIGVTVANGGTWYKTSHVDIEYTASDIDPEFITTGANTDQLLIDTFYAIAPIHLVLRLLDVKYKFSLLLQTAGGFVPVETIVWSNTTTESSVGTKPITETTAGAAIAATAIATSTPIKELQIRLGTGVNYTPTSAATNLVGSQVASHQPMTAVYSAIPAVDSEGMLVASVTLPANEVYTFGEVGLYVKNPVGGAFVLWYIGVLDVAKNKIACSTTNGNIITLTFKLHYTDVNKAVQPFNPAFFNQYPESSTARYSFNPYVNRSYRYTRVSPLSSLGVSGVSSTLLNSCTSRQRGETDTGEAPNYSSNELSPNNYQLVFNENNCPRVHNGYDVNTSPSVNSVSVAVPYSAGNPLYNRIPKPYSDLLVGLFVKNGAVNQLYRVNSITQYIQTIPYNGGVVNAEFLKFSFLDPLPFTPYPGMALKLWHPNYALQTEYSFVSDLVSAPVIGGPTPVAFNNVSGTGFADPTYTASGSVAALGGAVTYHWSVINTSGALTNATGTSTSVHITAANTPTRTFTIKCYATDTFGNSSAITNYVVTVEAQTAPDVSNVLTMADITEQLSSTTVTAVFNRGEDTSCTLVFDLKVNVGAFGSSVDLTPNSQSANSGTTRTATFVNNLSVGDTFQIRATLTNSIGSDSFTTPTLTVVAAGSADPDSIYLHSDVDWDSAYAYTTTQQQTIDDDYVVGGFSYSGTDSAVVPVDSNYTEPPTTSQYVLIFGHYKTSSTANRKTAVRLWQTSPVNAFVGTTLDIIQKRPPEFPTTAFFQLREDKYLAELDQNYYYAIGCSIGSRVIESDPVNNLFDTYDYCWMYGRRVNVNVAAGDITVGYGQDIAKPEEGDYIYKDTLVKTDVFDGNSNASVFIHGYSRKFIYKEDTSGSGLHQYYGLVANSTFYGSTGTTWESGSVILTGLTVPAYYASLTTVSPYVELISAANMETAYAAGRTMFRERYTIAIAPLGLTAGVPRFFVAWINPNSTKQLVVKVYTAGSPSTAPALIASTTYTLSYNACRMAATQLASGKIGLVIQGLDGTSDSHVQQLMRWSYTSSLTAEAYAAVTTDLGTGSGSRHFNPALVRIGYGADNRAVYSYSDFNDGTSNGYEYTRLIDFDGTPAFVSGWNYDTVPHNTGPEGSTGIGGYSSQLDVEPNPFFVFRLNDKLTLFRLDAGSTLDTLNIPQQSQQVGQSDWVRAVVSFQTVGNFTLDALADFSTGTPTLVSEYTASCSGTQNHNFEVIGTGNKFDLQLQITHSGPAVVNDLRVDFFI